jgi:polysaccharide pyruvyl transferase CsaB
VLEALACGKPVIMCGDYGWAGRFTRENAERCEATNFTLRGFGYPEDVNGELLEEILRCLNNDTNDTNDIREDCEYGAELIRSKYSVKKMADDAYSVYQKAVLRYKNYDFTLSGYYGYNNIGDDALLFLILSNIFNLKGDLKICVLTRNPRKIQKNLDNYFANVVTKPRFNFLTVQRAIKKSRALVFGGGTLLQDSTSSRSLWYYLWLIKTARRYNKKAMLYASGIGPLLDKANQKRVKRAAEYINLATIRDEESYDYLINLGIDKSKVYFTADEAVTIKDYYNHTDISRVSDFREFIKEKYIAVSIRKWRGLGSEFFEKFAAAVDSICREHNLIPVYIVMRPEEDRAVSQKLASLNSRAYVADTNGDIGKILSVMKSAEAVVAMRLHALIFAAAFGVPMIGVSYDPKVRSFMEMVYGSGNYTAELDGFNKDALVGKFRSLYSNHGELSRRISDKAQELCDSAAQNAQLFLEELEETGDK